MGKIKKTVNKNSPNVEKKLTSKIKESTSFKAKKTVNKNTINEKNKLKVKVPFVAKPQKTETVNEDVTNYLNEDTVRSGIKALFNVIEKNKNDKRLFEDDLPIFLHFCTVKIGKTPSRTLRAPLKHSLFKDSADICLIIPDAKGRNKKEYEKTIEDCEDLLRKANIENIKTIMTYYQLRTDYSEFELKRKLVELYDLFLVDGKLSNYVDTKLGKIFRKRRKLPIPVRLNAKNLKEHMESRLKKTSTNIHPNGDNFVIQVGHSEMNEEEIYDNIVEVFLSLSTQIPGGWGNIKSLNIKTSKSISIPIYYGLKNPKEISTPVVKAKRPKAFKTVEGELSTVNDRIVTVLPSGKVTVSQQVQKPKQNKSKKTKKSRDGPRPLKTKNPVTNVKKTEDVNEVVVVTKGKKLKRKHLENGVEKSKKPKIEEEDGTKTLKKKLKKNPTEKFTPLLKPKKSTVTKQSEVIDKNQSKKLKKNKNKPIEVGQNGKHEHDVDLKVFKIKTKNSQDIITPPKQKKLQNGIKTKKPKIASHGLEQLFAKKLDSKFKSAKKAKTITKSKDRKPKKQIK